MSEWVYAIGAINGEVKGPEQIECIKIGVTGSCPKKRLSTLQTGNHRKLILLYALDTERSDWAYNSEAHMHSLLAPYRTSGEWFSTSQKEPLHLSKMFFTSNGVNDPGFNWQPIPFYDEGV